MKDINKIVGQNIQTFLESRNLNNLWVMERAEIDKNAFYDMLNGNGNIGEHITKIHKLFGINDPMYFYKTDCNYAKPKNLLNHKENLLNYVASSNPGEITPGLKEGLKVFVDFVELIDVLKATTQ
ncbi:hypothetical protein [Bacillus sp. NH11B]|uniref:hypothetical protein n=1 Tax=Bacillus sp. NH11B TaxID=1866314 RepID=UPI0008FE4FA4|nr:hypothetical protein [Bacillus sp. NH11B]OJD60905.1 hypothetical protein BAU27_13480 [Bacillus sp. NH11B]